MPKHTCSLLLALLAGLAACGDESTPAGTTRDQAGTTEAGRGGPRASSTPAEGGRPPSIALISFDTLRADHLGCYGYDRWGASISPEVDGLAAKGVLFERCWAPRGQTRPSLSSMLSGKYPITTGLRENRLTLLDSHRTVFEDLHDAGYQVGIFLANFDTENMGGRWAFRGADKAFQGKRADDTGDAGQIERLWDERTEQAALEWIATIDPARPYALWVHFFDIHDPYNPPREFDLYGHAPDLPAVLVAPDENSGPALTELLSQITLGAHEPTPQEIARITGLYDGGVTATDARLGRLLDALDAADLSRQTCFVFTADHGEELFDHNRYFFHDSSIYPGTLRIPLILAGPGLPAGERREAQVQNLDLAATLLDIAGLPVPADMESRSILPLARGDSTEPTRPFAFIEMQDILYCVVDKRWLYVHNPRHAQMRKAPYFGTQHAFPIGCFEAYDLLADPLAQHDLLAGLEPALLGTEAGLPEHLRPLRAALLRWLNEPQHERAMTWPGVTADALPDMKALGYVGGDAERKDVLFLEDCRGSR